MRRICLLLSLLLWTLSQAAGLEAAQKYYFKDLDTLGGNNSSAAAINSQGQVVGKADTVTGIAHAFLQHPDKPMQDLGTLGGPTSQATGINDAGQIVGTSDTSLLPPPFSGYYKHAFLSNQGGPMADLGTLGGGFSSAVGINAGGLIVGVAETENSLSSPQHAFLCSTPGHMQDLGNFTPAAINDNALIVGYRPALDNVYHLATHLAVLFTGGVLHDLNSPGPFSEAYTINKGDQIAGLYNYSNLGDGDTIAYWWDAAGVGHELGPTYSSSANGINSRGQIVGTAPSTAFPYNNHAFLKNPGGLLQDLNDLVVNLPTGVTLVTAAAINDKGWIVGDTNGAYSHAYLLVPLTGPSGSVAASLLLLMN